MNVPNSKFNYFLEFFFFVGGERLAEIAERALPIAPPLGVRCQMSMQAKPAQTQGMPLN